MVMMESNTLVFGDAQHELARAREIVDRVGAWVGWDLWELDHESIVLDGEFSIQQLEALTVVLKHQSLATREACLRKIR